MKKLVNIFLIMLLFLISILPLVNTSRMNMNFYDQLDQQQIIFDWGMSIGDVEREGAQSFKPTLRTLTRVELYISEVEPAVNSFFVSIKKDGLKTFDLTSVSVSPGFIPDLPEYGWIEFDFPDIQVIPEETYYIVAKAENGADKYSWRYNALDNHYHRGSMFYKWEEIDNIWHENEESDWCFKTYGFDNLPPEKPDKPEGSASGKPGVSYVYSSSAIDPDGDKIYYKFDWGDDTDSGWLGKYNSGEICEAAHTWESEGTYPVKVIVKDENDEESVWSDSLSVSMPKNKFLIDMMLGRFPIFTTLF